MDNDDRGRCPWCGDDQEIWQVVADDEERWQETPDGGVYDNELRCSTCDQVYRVRLVHAGEAVLEARITRA